MNNLELSLNGLWFESLLEIGDYTPVCNDSCLCVFSNDVVSDTGQEIEPEPEPGQEQEPFIKRDKD